MCSEKIVVRQSKKLATNYEQFFARNSLLIFCSVTQQIFHGWRHLSWCGVHCRNGRRPNWLWRRPKRSSRRPIRSSWLVTTSDSSWFPCLFCHHPLKCTRKTLFKSTLLGMPETHHSNGWANRSRVLDEFRDLKNSQKRVSFTVMVISALSPWSLIVYSRCTKDIISRHWFLKL